jgi:hypothetical protein
MIDFPIVLAFWRTLQRIHHHYPESPCGRLVYIWEDHLRICHLSALLANTNMVRCRATCFITCRIFASFVTVVLVIIHFHTSNIICGTILCTALDIDTIDGTFFHVSFAYVLCIITYFFGYAVGRYAFDITKRMRSLHEKRYRQWCRCPDLYTVLFCIRSCMCCNVWWWQQL